MDVQENSQQQEEEEVLADVFDLLPDVLVLEIFNRVEDARSLSACSVLCKRFGDLVPQTHNVSLEITRKNTIISRSKVASGLIGRLILKPILAILHRLVSRKSKTCKCEHDDEEDDDDKMFRLPNHMLHNFKEIKSLSVKLPGHEGDISDSGSVLKWKAEFGKQLESCVILGATGFQKSKTEGDHTSRSNNLTNKQLKKRVVWTISCLIASSARHHMLKQIIRLNGMIKDVNISDGSKQGTIAMTENQVIELRNDMNINNMEMERTKVPAVTIKMWYMPELELTESGGVMKGATLAVIRPMETEVVRKDDDVTLALSAFGEDKCLAEAVRKLVGRKKSYTLEMNSF